METAKLRTTEGNLAVVLLLSLLCSKLSVEKVMMSVK